MKTSRSIPRRSKHPLHKRFLGALRDHFIPHPGNNHVPHVLHHRALFGYSVILIALKVMVVAVGITFPGYSLFSSAITPANIISLTNETRRSLELPELTTDPKLMQAAQAKAEDMFLNGYFAHTSPSGVTPWYWFKTYGYDYRSAGENLAAHFTEAEDVEAGWMASPTHRDNIVSDRYAEIGVGVAQGMYDGYQTTFVVQMFGYELGQEDDQIEAAPVIPEVTPETTPPAPTPITSVVVQAEPVASEVLSLTELGTDDITTPEAVLGTQPESDPEALNIDLASLVVSPIESGYAVEIHMDNASQAVLYMGSTHVPFVSTETPGLWKSVVMYNPATMNSSGEQLYMVAGGVNGDQQTQDLAWIMPGAKAPEVYAFKAPKSPKLLGVMDVANVDDIVHQIYIFTLIFLGAALCIGVFVKIEVQKPTMIAHSLAVITLALLLTIT